MRVLKHQSTKNESGIYQEIEVEEGSPGDQGEVEDIVYTVTPYRWLVEITFSGVVTIPALCGLAFSPIAI